MADDLKALSDAATQGEWTGHNMVHAEDRPMTPEELGEYVTNSVKMSSETRFLFVSGKSEQDMGDVDICHVGNGPKGPQNTALIVALVNAYRAGDLVPATAMQPTPQEAKVRAKAEELYRDHCQTIPGPPSPPLFSGTGPLWRKQQAEFTEKALQFLADEEQKRGFMTPQEAAKVLLAGDVNGGRQIVYDACANRFKAYKFDAILRAISEDSE